MISLFGAQAKRLPFPSFNASPEIIRLAVMLEIRFPTHKRPALPLLSIGAISWHPDARMGDLDNLRLLSPGQTRLNATVQRFLAWQDCSEVGQPWHGDALPQAGPQFCGTVPPPFHA